MTSKYAKDEEGLQVGAESQEQWMNRLKYTICCAKST